jgi:hypothetical protein
MILKQYKDLLIILIANRNNYLRNVVLVTFIKNKVISNINIFLVTKVKLN